MLKIFLVLPLFLLCRPCFAEEVKQYDRQSPASDDQLIVGLECNRTDNRLEIGLYTPYELPNRAMDLWDTFDLKKNPQEGESVGRVLSVVRRCNLGQYRYRVKITGRPVRWSLQGECGSLTYARATVWRNGKRIFDEDISSCEDFRISGEHVLKSIVFLPTRSKPILRSGKTLSDLLESGPANATSHQRPQQP